jgi:1,4-alpha-glucan branching enzyme
MEKYSEEKHCMKRKKRTLNFWKFEPESNASGNNGNSRIKKQYIKSGSVCKVTFTLPKEAAPEAKQVHIAGDFNNWDCNSTSMKKLRNGNFSITLALDTGREYRFRYLIDHKKWENDWNADKYVPNSYSCYDSVVVV